MLDDTIISNRFWLTPNIKHLIGILSYNVMPLTCHCVALSKAL